MYISCKCSENKDHSFQGCVILSCLIHAKLSGILYIYVYIYNLYVIYIFKYITVFIIFRKHQK